MAAPPLGAGPDSVTVTLVCPQLYVGFGVAVMPVGTIPAGAAGVTVKVAVLLAPFSVAVIVTVVVLVTA